MICFPNAKINLGLNIVSKRPDGYHNLETVFYPIGLKDALEIVSSVSGEKYRFFQSGIYIQENTDDNLVIKALNLISEEKDIPPIDIHLLKKIPFGAGLGGGSSDAAFMLRLLNETFQLQYSDEKLMQLATKIGADCPFFIKNRPAFATGIGDELEDININLDNYFFILVKPPIAVPTKDAYAMIMPQQPEISLKEIVQLPISEWKNVVRNDFEVPVFKKYPEISAVKNRLYDLGAIYASMSGSGSAVFGIFEKKIDVEDEFDGCFVWKK
ncbi:MAG: 4-(cytidine 5'-diphospho)-2-C-methyl-D-erythritol kinase [Dysgonamonadaceae bacterium]|jgi:4-diphosphocytidyl-2-C-methyl-D-erythritol kinase|nr:4-(cytidine 5'-diphospho)-2-C-methyl-D-erythritol kinase [Dysgonamonadaceae bacterium]